ncbi:MAG: alpha/beta hydrolase [Niastella sp.]|nr:alpha/beta hydrolase [Niastella sp.]
MSVRTFYKDLVKAVICLASLALYSEGHAQQVVPLYKGKPPGNLSTDNKEQFVRPEKGRPSIINVTQPTITVYLPEHPNAAGTSVVICPGGGYLRLTIEDGGYDVAKNLAAAGIAAFVLKYRTWRDSTFIAYRDLPMQDLQQAFSIIRANAAQWKIDTSHIGVLGFSAGGHLAAMGSVSTRGFRPAFTWLAYPVVSFTDSLVSRTLKSRSTLLGNSITQQDKEAYSPELHVTVATPPAFIVHAADDSTSLVGNSIVYYKALLAKRVPAQMTLYQKGGHGFAQYNAAQDENWLPAAIKWLRLNGFYKQ